MRQISYIRKVPGWTVSKQRETVGADAVEYGDDTPQEALASIRDGDELVVAAARVLADNRDAIAYAIKEVNKRGGTLIEVSTGHDSRQHGATIMADAVAALANEDRVKHRQNGAKGSGIRWGSIKRMNKREALVHWVNPKHSTDEALALMPGWKKATAYRALGVRGVPPGRR